MVIDLTGRVAVVTGGSQGLGRAIAERLAQAGAQVVIASRDPARLQAAAEALNQGAAAGRVTARPADITSEEDVRNLVTGVAAEFGGVHILVANGGGPRAGRFEELTPADWEAAFRLTLLSYVLLIREVLPFMRRAGWGRILAVTTSGMLQPIPGLLLSNAFRAAVWGMLKTLAGEVGEAGIHVFNLAPGRFDTERVRWLDQLRAEQSGRPVEEVRRESERQIPLGRYGDPRELGDVAVFLCSDAARYLTGITIPVDGGMVRTL